MFAINKPKKNAIIVDLDGTLANLNGRLPYGDAQANCGNDLVREDVQALVEAEMQERFILIVSGRFDTYLPQTIDWLDKNDLPWDEIFMRKEGDQRADNIIKQEIYEQHIEPYYKIHKVFDDRPKVIRMWRELGLNVIDVGNGIEF